MFSMKATTHVERIENLSRFSENFKQKHKEIRKDQGNALKKITNIVDSLSEQVDNDRRN